MIAEMLERDPASFPDQDRFGKSDNPAGKRGNCFQACLASILGRPLAEIPHFYDTDEPIEDQRATFQNWMAECKWVALWIPLDWTTSEWVVLPPQAIVMVSGKSPRGDWGHLVVGQVTSNGWRLVHDPHYSRAGLDGKPDGFYLVAPLPTLSHSVPTETQETDVIL